MNNTDQDFNKRLFDALKEMQQPKKDTKAFNYKYATLENVVVEVKKALEPHGLFFMQEHRVNHIITTICDSHSLRSRELAFSMPPVPMLSKASDKSGFTAQDYCSYITYMKRYALMMVFGLYAEDDDAAAISRPQAPARAQGNTTNKGPWKEYDHA